MAATVHSMAEAIAVHSEAVHLPAHSEEAAHPVHSVVAVLTAMAEARAVAAASVAEDKRQLRRQKIIGKVKKIEEK